MWQYNLTGELYHYGVPGMKWGVKRTDRSLNRKNASDHKRKGLTVSQASRQAKIDKVRNKNQRPKDTTEKYWQNQKNNAKIRRIGYGSKIAGSVMTSIGKKMYNQYKFNATPGKVAVINALGHGGKALSGIGDVAVTTSLIKQVVDTNKWLHSK